jgi:hypothetical protein
LVTRHVDCSKWSYRTQTLLDIAKITKQNQTLLFLVLLVLSGLL